MIGTSGSKVLTYFRSAAMGEWKKASDFSNFTIQIRATEVMSKD
jgi:hypothetical protein